MMGYYEDVYLKRFEREGRTRQERVMARKEVEFDRLFLKNTQYQALIYEINGVPAHIVISLQPSRHNEQKIISNILVSRQELLLKTGDMLKIRQTVGTIEYDNIWLILFKEENIGKGYQGYKAMNLDTEINITNEYGDTINSFPAKMVSATSTFILDTFSYGKSFGYREPNRNLFFVTQSQDFLKKDTYFEYKQKGFQISGIDDISIDGVSYVTFSERLKREAEPRSSEDIPVGYEKNFFLNNT